MRVLLVSPASHVGGAGVSGGIAGYVADLAERLVAVGCTVGLVSAGHVYRPSVLGRRLGLRPRAGRCRAEELPQRDGVRRFQIVNSPVLAPSLWQFGHPEGEVSPSAVLHAFGDVCRRFAADIVHVHGLEGFGTGLVDVSRRSGAAVMFSVHNYHPFCPQVYMLRGRRQVCVDYEGGAACETCESAIHVGDERTRRATGRGTAPSIVPPERAPVMTFDAAGQPSTETRALWRNGHPLWEPIENGLPDAGASRRVSGRYGERRAAYVEALNRCKAVLAVSSATAEICMRMGVRADITRVEPIGSWAAAVPLEERPAQPELDAPVRFVFLGFGAYPKGLGVLCDALLLLTPEVRSHIVLVAHGPGVAEDVARLDAVRNSFAGLECGGPFGRGDVVRLLTGAHAMVVPSVWQDNGPQTAIEGRALGVPVIGSRIGGIPDIIADGVDGVLFRANDRLDLARVLASFVRKPDRLSAIRRSMRAWITMSDHVDTLIGLYKRALSSSGEHGSTELV